MDKLDRFQQLHRIFTSHKRPVALKKIAEKLECTEKSAHRLIENLRDYWQVPVEYNKEAKGWHYNLAENEKVELPGIWLTSNELQSLIALLHLLHSMDDGLVLQQLSVVEQTVTKLLKARGVDVNSFTSVIKYLPMAKRATQARIFSTVADALLNKKQLELKYKDYWGRVSQRSVSPQNLIYYKENWHLDAWCHLREDLRTFSISRIEQTVIRKEPAKKIEQQQLQEYFASSYGIFSGKAKHTARLRFFPEVAREIASQQWHPEQKGEWQGKEYLLEVPYNNETELVMDILKYSNNVEVLGPSKLQKAVLNKLRSALLLYSYCT